MWHAQRLVSSVVRRQHNKFLCRHYSASAALSAGPPQDIKIWYASQSGTAQLFAHQLAEGVEEELPDSDVMVQGLHEHPPESFLSSNASSKNEEEDIVNFFLVSCTGVGEVPSNGRAFFEWVMASSKSDGDSATPNDWNQVNYAVFGLGNQQAHPNHYNVIGKKLDAQLDTLGANRMQPLGLGDDGDCLDDDFDQWMEETLERLKLGVGASDTEEVKEHDENTTSTDSSSSPAEAEMDIHTERSVRNDDLPRISCPEVSILPDGTRFISKKYPTLSLKPATSDVVRHDLFFLQSSSTSKTKSNAFYSESTRMLPVIQNERLALDGGEAGMQELQISLPKDVQYISGDHLLVYPRNSDAMVQAYVDLLEVDPHAIIVKGDDDEGNSNKYPYPTGITVMETLMHCVELGAPPSPLFARTLLGRKDMDYKEEIAIPRRTIIDLVLEQKRKNNGTGKLSLEDLLYQASPMKPRYYSIASSNVQYPHTIHLAYRPIKYVSSYGYLREGVCSSYLSHKGVLTHDIDSRDRAAACIPASVVPHPTFRLPSSPETPVLMIGGGSGMAPIRSFLQERVFLSSSSSSSSSNNNGNNKFGPGILFMGYRNPHDEIYRKLVEEALECGALTDAQIVYSSGCTLPTQKTMMVSELIRENGMAVWEHMQSGGHIYICGGAYAFGVTVKAELLDLVQEHGKMTFEESEDHLRTMMDEGRFCADLAG
ncbi:unnamed protein product [Cylindrotheca closterium]|uniref:NADPH--hemoprotein reductase n=1 Tax=Cylindrotheca closterium TaxID=2856 RepID=A0AAD2JIR0_9STRA|nr:unnamed protein product [Cylindrotheca closterium]